MMMVAWEQPRIFLCLSESALFPGMEQFTPKWPLERVASVSSGSCNFISTTSLFRFQFCSHESSNCIDFSNFSTTQWLLSNMSLSHTHSLAVSHTFYCTLSLYRTLSLSISHTLSYSLSFSEQLCLCVCACVCVRVCVRDGLSFPIPIGYFWLGRWVSIYSTAIIPLVNKMSSPHLKWTRQKFLLHFSFEKHIWLGKLRLDPFPFKERS